VSGALPVLLASIPSPPSPVIDIGPLSLRWYGVMIALGVLVAVEIARRRWAAKGGDPDEIVAIAMWAVPAGLVGARLYHVLTDWRDYQGRWLDAVKIWEGGLGIPGGLAAGVLVGVWVAHRRGMDLRRAADAVVPAIPVGQAIGRLGNWFNQELFGGPTGLPWGLEIDPERRPARYADQATFHPAFLYEGLWNLGLAAWLVWLDRRHRVRPGQILPLWVAGYGVGRFLVESVRIDPASLVWGIRVNHWVAALAVVGGLIGFWWAGRTAPPRAAPAAAEPAAAGDAAGGAPAGEAAAGGPVAGETPAGGPVAGETPAGEAPAGGAPAGEAPAGGPPAGEAAAGGSAVGEAASGEAVAGDPGVGRPSPGGPGRGSG
jgi:prolipoprotein diacylglyceryl transferase